MPLLRFCNTDTGQALPALHVTADGCILASIRGLFFLIESWVFEFRWTNPAGLKDSILKKCRLFLEKIEEGLTVTVHYLGRRSATSLFFHQNLRLKKRTQIVDAFVRNPHFHGFGALIAR